MTGDFSVELISKRNDIFAGGTFRGAAIPDLSLTQEVESATVNDSRRCADSLCLEEDRRTKDALKSADDPAILLPSLRHAKAIEHLCGGTKSDYLAFPANGQSRKENEDQPVLSKRQTELRVSGDLKEEVPVPPLEEKLVGRRLADRKAAEDEWAGGDRKRLLSVLPIEADQCDSVRLLEPISRYDELAVSLSQDVTGSCQTSLFGTYLPNGSPLYKAIRCS